MSSVICIECVFVGSGVRYCMDLLVSFREFFFSPSFRDSWAAVSGCFSSLFLLFLPPFFSWGRPGLLFFSSGLWLAGPLRRRRQVRPCIAHATLLFFFFLLSLPGRPPSPFPFSSLSFCLSLSLSCMNSVNLAAPASSHTLVATTKPCLFQHKRCTASLQRAH